MKNRIFLEERLENGIRFLISKDTDTGKVLHWEPLATRIRGYEAALLRQEVGKRSEIYLDFNGKLAIIPLQPLLNHQGQTWIGWEEQTGISIFNPKYVQPEVLQLMRDLYPIIQAYAIYHQKGMVVGRPEWCRIYHQADGFFMPDPWSRPFLQSPEIKIPAGLSACRSPESYFGESPGQTGDLYYLGLILYFLISGKIPYILEDGWPTSALLKGDIIPLAFYRPELSPKLTQTIEKLLVPKKYERPLISEIQTIWDELSRQEIYWATPVERNNNVIYLKKRAYRQFFKFFKKIPLRKITVGLFIAVFIVITAGYLLGSFAKTPTARQIAQDFYQNTNPVKLVSDSITENVQKGDIINAREKRLTLIAELLRKPVVEVKKLAILSESPDTATIEAKLLWWNWTHDSWNSYTTTELLSLSKKKNRWEVTKRVQKKLF